MSYDIIIRGDDAYQVCKTQDDIYRAIATVPEALINGPDHVLVGWPETGLLIEMDIEHLTAQGDLVDDGDHTRRNAVTLHIPYAFVDQSRELAFDIALRIAHYLGWRVYDPQEGRYV